MNSTRWRSIVIGENSQLSCTEGQMTVRTSEKKDVLIPLYDVQTVIVTSTRMGMTPLLGNGFDFERLTASVIEIG